MSVISPPRPPEPTEGADLEALIKEARARQRRRRIRVALVLGAAAALGGGLYAMVAEGGSATKSTSDSGRASAVSHRCPPGDLGTVAFTRGGALILLDLQSCKTRVLVRAHAVGPVQFSFDGRYVGFFGGFASTGSGRITHIAGSGTWSPTADVLVDGTKKGGLVLIAPGRSPRGLLPDGWGVLTYAFAPSGKTLAVSRSHYAGPSTPRSKRDQQIWLINLATGTRKMIFELPSWQLAPQWVQGFSPDGKWVLFWEDIQNSASMAADGLPLLAVPASGGKGIPISRLLHYSDVATWCNGSLVYVIDHNGRGVTLGDGLAVTKPPLWRSQTILPSGGKTSWTSVACPSAAAAAKGGGGLVVAAGPSNADIPFGREHRSLWMVGPQAGARPQRLSQTVPPKGQTDELPMWSGDGRWILFVRTNPSGNSNRGQLYALDPFGGNLVGPIASIGSSANYYGSYSWPYQLDWHR
jgi:hypothetical protein